MCHAPLPHIQVQRLRLGPRAPGAQQLRRARLVHLCQGCASGSRVLTARSAAAPARPPCPPALAKQPHSPAAGLALRLLSPQAHWSARALLTQLSGCAGALASCKVIELHYASRCLRSGGCPLQIARLPAVVLPGACKTLPLMQLLENHATICTCLHPGVCRTCRRVFTVSIGWMQTCAHVRAAVPANTCRTCRANRKKVGEQTAAGRKQGVSFRSQGAGACPVRRSHARR